jgi:hypothetical protein
MIAFFGILLLSGKAWAWDQHRVILERMLSQPAALSRNAFLDTRVRIPCQEEERREIEQISGVLGINAAKVPLYSGIKCGKKGSVPQEQMVRALLLSDFVDEPDLGMDQDLPESLDPNGDRAWMGGVSGPTSQGFRHMVFPGIEWSSPLRTLQIPFRSVGMVLERIEILKATSERYFEQKNLFWGLRTLLWKVHLIQDLHQPFHVTQVPDVRMLPWRSLFRGFVGRSTQSIANYHYAYEALSLELLREPGDRGIGSCLEVGSGSGARAPAEILLRSRAVAPALGVQLMGVLGTYPQAPGVDLPAGIGQLDTFAIIRGKPGFEDPEDVASINREERLEIERENRTVESMRELRTLTCERFRELAETVWAEFDRLSRF